MAQQLEYTICLQWVQVLEKSMVVIGGASNLNSLLNPKLHDPRTGNVGSTYKQDKNGFLLCYGAPYIDSSSKSNEVIVTRW